MTELEKYQEKYRQMTETPVKRLVCRMAVPTIISMLITSFYNMADTFFVGRINTSATASVGIVFSLMAIIQAVGFLFGQGSGNYISRKLGEQKREEASRMAATGFFSAICAGLVIAVVGLLFLTPIARLLGATDTILPYAEDYMRFILIGAPYMTASLVLNNQLRLQGNAFYAMLGLTSGAVLNIALDPLFIFGLHLGTGGAALATILSQLVSFVVLLIGCQRGGSLPIRPKMFSPSLARYRAILGGGLPSLCRQGLASAAIICLNLAAGSYGDSAIAAMSIVNRVTMFASSALLGFGQGFQPVCGFNYGAKRFDRVREAYWFCVRVALVALSLLAVTGFVFAPSIITAFRGDDAQLIGIGARALRLQCVSFPLLGWIIPCNMMLQNIGKTFKASLLSVARQGLFFLPLVFLLPVWWGIFGVQICQPIADILTFFLSVPLGYSVLRELREGSLPGTPAN
ncbi:MATE efflux family protein [[Clostridium] methylpentosum DSM 5476]|uniref:Multidrug export protein MepA n=1 Tax=[Clostridium] methylpentosum DSM 5476 TaxID=537013 RepID=C0EJ16_9FIRM|nr:MATE efflux family protein [[Clostridium] methylpentosum DSM 5476]MEE1492524.1 MATE family efflux transporter [Massilioclostridium sp.]